jgi:hypothetical protein
MGLAAWGRVVLRSALVAVVRKGICCWRAGIDGVAAGMPMNLLLCSGPRGTIDCSSTICASTL